MKTRSVKKSLLVAAVCGATVLSLGSGAHAGEITGNGKDTPIRDYTAKSICAFSGLNDDTGFFEGKTQNWGQIPKEFREVLKAEGEAPGTACRGNASF